MEIAVGAGPAGFPFGAEIDQFQPPLGHRSAGEDREDVVEVEKVADDIGAVLRTVDENLTTGNDVAAAGDDEGVKRPLAGSLAGLGVADVAHQGAAILSVGEVIEGEDLDPEPVMDRLGHHADSGNDLCRTSKARPQPAAILSIAAMILPSS